MIDSPWRGKNPQRTTGGMFTPELWSGEIINQMLGSLEITDKLTKEVNDDYADSVPVVRIKSKPARGDY